MATASRPVMDNVELETALARLERSLLSLADTRARLGTMLERSLGEMHRCIYQLEVATDSVAAARDTGSR